MQLLRKWIFWTLTKGCWYLVRFSIGYNSVSDFMFPMLWIFRVIFFFFMDKSGHAMKMLAWKY